MRRDATLGKAERAKLGAHYTPYEMALRVVERAIHPLMLHHCPACNTSENILRLVVIDPACGDGVFLQAAEDLLAPLLLECLQWDDAFQLDVRLPATLDDCRKLIQENVLTGYDVDPGAVELTRQRFPHCPDIACLDSLFDLDLDLEGRPAAFVGNPPFMGGGKISGTFGAPYLKRLLLKYPSSNGGADLCTYFFLLASHLLDHSGSKGTVSFIATNTISQGRTREAGLAFLLQQRGMLIYAADTNLPWPGVAKVSVSIVHMANNALSWEGWPLQMLEHAMRWPSAWPEKAPRLERLTRLERASTSPV